MHDFLFGVYPYIALTVMAIVSIVRYERDPFTWKSKSSQLLRKKQFVMGSVLFHVGVLIIFFGHLFGLLVPMPIYEFFGISHGAKQILAIIAGGVAGLMAVVGGWMLLHRRLYDERIRAHSSFGDTAVMVLLMLQLVLGLATIFVSVQHLDGSAMVLLMRWAQAIIYFQPGAAEYLVGTHWLFKAHLVVGLTIFLVFPFTRLVHIVSAPVRYLWRPGYQIVRTRWGAKPATSGLKPYSAADAQEGK